MQSYEVRLSDAVENTGLDGRRFATRGEAQQAANLVEMEFPQARACVVQAYGEADITFADWERAGWA